MSSTYSWANRGLEATNNAFALILDTIIMGLSLGSFIWSVVLLLNSVAILNEDRFLARSMLPPPSPYHQRDRRHSWLEPGLRELSRYERIQAERHSSHHLHEDSVKKFVDVYTRVIINVPCSSPDFGEHFYNRLRVVLGMNTVQTYACCLRGRASRGMCGLVCIGIGWCL